MRFFEKPKTVKLEQDAIKRAWKFAEDVVATVDYSDTNQANKIKVKQDHFVSKIGEEAAKKVFEELGHEVEGPDYKIYEGKKKSWAPDLKIDGIPLAIKTQRRTEANKYGLSWTFQIGPYRKDPVLHNQENWVCFVEFVDRSYNNTCTVYPPYQIKELTFSEPIMKYLIGSKKVVYAKDLPVIQRN